MLGLLSQATHAQLMARGRASAAGSPRAPTSPCPSRAYPVLQGYDSLALDADLTIVGSDQLFLQRDARPLTGQQRAGRRPQVVITTKITPGI